MRLGRSILSGALLFALLLTATTAAVPRTAFACSCMAPEPIATYKGDSLKMVFAGTVATAGAAGVEVVVEQWFQGSGARLVTLAPEGFGDQGAACQERIPPIGSRWIWVAFIPEIGQAPQVNLCTPKAPLDAPEGVKMLTEAQEAFGSGEPPPTPAPEEPAAPAPGPAADSVSLVVPLVGVGLAALVVFGAVALLARRRGRSG